MKHKINWRRVAICYLFCGLAFAALIIASRSYLHAGAASAGPPSPRLAVDKTRNDFGNVNVGIVLRKTFQLRNNGKERLVLNRVVCGTCGDPNEFEPIILAPGQRSPLTLTLDTAGRTGRIQRTFRFSSSDPQRPRIVFTLLATVRTR